MTSIEFSNQNGGGTGEQAGQKWLAEDVNGNHIGNNARVVGVIVNASDAAEGWVQLRDSSTVDDDLKPFATIQAETGFSHEYNFPGMGYTLGKGLYLRKANDTIVYILFA